MNENKRSALPKILIIVFLAIWALIVLFPFYWMVLTSFKDTTLFMDEKVPTFFTTEPTLQNYADAFTAVPLAKYFINTIIFTLVTTGLMMIVIIPAAFAFARLDIKPILKQIYGAEGTHAGLVALHGRQIIGLRLLQKFVDFFHCESSL